MVRFIAKGFLAGGFWLTTCGLTENQPGLLQSGLVQSQPGSLAMA